MTAKSQDPSFPAPVAETVSHPTDALAWNKIPNGKCVLNYRPRNYLPAGCESQTLATLVLVSLGGPIAVSVCQFLGNAVLTRSTFFAVAVAAVLFIIGLLLHHDPAVRRRLLDQNDWLLAGALLTPPGILLALVLLALGGTGAAAGLVWVLFAAPLAVCLADQLGVHALSWYSAHYRNDLATLSGWRNDWTQRWKGTPDRQPREELTEPSQRELHHRVLQARREYADGVGFLSAALAVAIVIAGFMGRTSDAATSGAWFGASLLVALAGAAALRVQAWPGAWARSWRMLLHWTNYRRDEATPPWVWQSPCSNPATRANLLWIVAWALSAALWLGTCGWARLAGPTLVGDSAPLDMPVPVQWLQAIAGYAPSALEHPVLALVHATLFLAATCLSTVMVLYLIVVIIAGPTIEAHFRALAAADAYEHHRNWVELDGYSARLRASDYELEKNAIIVGFSDHHEYPVLVDRKLHFEHQLKVGPTGSGKSTLGLATDAIQLIRRNDAAVTIFDGKGDIALFHTAREEALAAGRTFKWFTNLPHRSTYVFDPFDPAVHSRLTLQQVLGKLTSALNLQHGSDYARAWFSMSARIALKRALELSIARKGGPGGAKFPPIVSFLDLYEALAEVARGRELESARHLLFVIESLTEFTQLNLSPTWDAAHPVRTHAIRMSEALREKQVIYFFLCGATDVASVGTIGSLLLYETLFAATEIKHQTGKVAPCYFLADEAQTIIGYNVANVLAQCRSYGLSVTFALQSLSQLAPPGGADLRELVLGSTTIKQIFAARDPWFQKYLSDVSGRVRYFTPSYRQRVRDVRAGQIGIPHLPLTNELGGSEMIDIQEYIGPKLNAQAIRDYGFDPQLSILCIERGEGLTQFRDYFPMRTWWPTSKQTYEDRDERTPWPASIDSTIEVASDWPSDVEGTIVPTTHPRSAASEAAIEDVLRNWKKRLGGEA